MHQRDILEETSGGALSEDDQSEEGYKDMCYGWREHPELYMGHCPQGLNWANLKPGRPSGWLAAAGGLSMTCVAIRMDDTSQGHN